MKHVFVKKGWGSEEWIVNNDRYCGKILRVSAGHRGSMHFHKLKHETFYIDDGFMKLEIVDPATGQIYISDLKPGDSHELPPLTMHRFIATTDVKIIEFSTTHADDDTYRCSPGDSQK